MKSVLKTIAAALSLKEMRKLDRHSIQGSRPVGRPHMKLGAKFESNRLRRLGCKTLSRSEFWLKIQHFTTQLSIVHSVPCSQNFQSSFNWILRSKVKVKGQGQRSRSRSRSRSNSFQNHTNQLFFKFRPPLRANLAISQSLNERPKQTSAWLNILTSPWAILFSFSAGPLST